MQRILRDKIMDIFDRITQQEKHQLFKYLQAGTKTFSKGEIIFDIGDKVTSVGYVEYGRVELRKNDFEGNEIIVARVTKNETFAETFACTKVKSKVCATAIEETKVLFLNFNRILSVCTNSCPFHRKLLENLINVIATKNLLLQDRIELLSKKTLRERIFSLLLRQKQICGTDIFEIPYSREQMAQFLGANRSALSRELTRLKNENLIDFHQNLFRIVK